MLQQKCSAVWSLTSQGPRKGPCSLPAPALPWGIPEKLKQHVNLRSEEQEIPRQRKEGCKLLGEGSLRSTVWDFEHTSSFFTPVLWPCGTTAASASVLCYGHGVGRISGRQWSQLTGPPTFLPLFLSHHTLSYSRWLLLGKFILKNNAWGRELKAYLRGRALCVGLVVKLRLWCRGLCTLFWATYFPSLNLTKMTTVRA